MLEQLGKMMSCNTFRNLLRLHQVFREIFVAVVVIQHFPMKTHFTEKLQIDSIYTTLKGSGKQVSWEF